MVLVAASWGISLDEAREHADGLLNEFGIARLSSRFPHELSSGQTQLLALALSLARPFEVLLLDEPEQRLDADRLGRVGASVRSRVDGGATVVMASHSHTLVEQVADEMLELSEDAHELGE